MFTVVEHQQCPTVSQSFDHHLQQRPGGLIANAQRRGRRRNQQLTIAQVAQLDQPHAIAKFPDTFVAAHTDKVDLPIPPIPVNVTNREFKINSLSSASSAGLSR
ncbi:hypothetical protein I551_4601 [Mycobacterium ulcerans str. Harvey]|uniref:Uncharacterized protein n=1 Tax=Mycobacterium ulcerans str. Harvey TaxID=1299332 RepID=A0ABP3AGN0_MYCUL|nr:hypothetical protein I551_4601 [Mycobacterium ulcerans str. Harvey]